MLFPMRLRWCRALQCSSPPLWQSSGWSLSSTCTARCADRATPAVSRRERCVASKSWCDSISFVWRLSCLESALYRGVVLFSEGPLKKMSKLKPKNPPSLLGHSSVVTTENASQDSSIVFAGSHVLQLVLMVSS